MQGDLDVTSLYQMVRLDNPALGFDDAWRTTERITAAPGLPGSCVHQMPHGHTAIRGDKCLRCNSCPICRQRTGHIEGCQNHPDYFRDCLMDARYCRFHHGEV